MTGEIQRAAYAVVEPDEDDLWARRFPFVDGMDTVSVEPVRRSDSDSAGFLIGSWWSPIPSRPLHSTRCVSIARSTGHRCRQWAVIGFERCVTHSGYRNLTNLRTYRERVVDGARLGLLGGAPYATDNLMNLVTGRDVDASVTLTACLTVLDRVGLRGSNEQSFGGSRDGEEAASDVIRERLDRRGRRTGREHA